MIQILLIVFSILLLLIGWYFKGHLAELELVFTDKNHQNLKNLGNSYFILGIIGAVLGVFVAKTTIALFFVSIVLIVSATFSIYLSKNMK